METKNPNRKSCREWLKQAEQTLSPDMCRSDFAWSVNQSGLMSSLIDIETYITIQEIHMLTREQQKDLLIKRARSDFEYAIKQIEDYYKDLI